MDLDFNLLSIKDLNIPFINRFTFTSMLYRFNKKLDDNLNECLESGISKVNREGVYYRLEIEFSNGIKGELWDENKYYAWLSSGELGKYRWSACRPSRKTMSKMYYALKEYEENAEQARSMF